MKTLKEFLHRPRPTEESEIDVNSDGVLSPEELHAHLDVNGDGKVDIYDYAAHVMFHQARPELLAPYTHGMDPIQKRHSGGEEVREHDPILHALNADAALTVHSGMNEANDALASLYAKPKDPPAVLIMRRKSIRLFPNGQRVAMYYVDKINKYVTVPYTDLQWAATEEETVFDKVKTINENKQKMVVEHLDGSTTEVTPEIANKLMALYKKVNEQNKARMKDMLEASAEHFKHIVDFYKKI